MTYEMQIIGEGEPVNETEIKAAWERITAASHAQFTARTDETRRDASAEMIAAIVQLYTADVNYLELTAGGMHQGNEAMEGFGMLDLETQHDPWPKRAEFGVTQAMFDYGEEGEPKPLALFHAAMDAVTDKQAENPAGIPLYKFRTNDGWLVTGEEIRTALAAYRAALAEGRTAPELFWWPHWIAFLERAEKHGGFRVH